MMAPAAPPMPQRRAEDVLLPHLVESVSTVASGLAAHIAACTELQKHVRDQLVANAIQSTAMNEKLDKLLLERAGEQGEKRGGAKTRKAMWGAIGVALTVAGWVIEHFQIVQKISTIW